MATANKRSKKTSAGRSATAKKTTGTRASAARKPAAAARKPTGKGTAKPARKAAKTATGKAAKKAATAARTGQAAKKATAKKTAAKKKAAPKKAAAKKKAASKAAAPKKATAKKKAAPKKTAAKKKAASKTAAPKKATAKKAAPKKAAPKKAASKKAASKGGARKTRATARKAPVAPPVQGEPALFLPLSEGERAAALRLLTEDPRLAGMASVGRYRVIAVEPLVVKPKHELSKRRLARVVAYDYAAERSVDACVDIDGGTVTHLNIARTQPMLSREEEAAAIAIALGDQQVQSKLAPGDEPQVAMHYWSRAGTSLAYSRRSAAVLLGQPGRSPSLVAVVDLLDDLVCELVPAAEW